MENHGRRGIAPIVGAGIAAALLVGLGAGIFASPSILGSPASINYKPTAETKEFYLFTSVAEFNEDETGVPHDQFSPTAMIVNQGDTVKVHFYNVEDEDEHHNLVINAYNVNVDLGQGQDQTITFVADEAGTFLFYCSYHQPTMRGQLIVLPTS